ncbi:MAG: hydroxymethylbilane synthase, partial [Verrucomicrobiota bacterium]
RGSYLAMTQPRMTEAALKEAGIAVEIKVVKTIGDKRPDLKLSEFTEKVDGVHDKGVFTKELEEALLAGEIDFAVHSLKDVPTELGPDFEICTALPRAPITDVLITREPAQLDEWMASDRPLTIATSSVRRARQLLWRFPNVKIVDIRGNVPTRIQKLHDNPDWDGIILARAGIQRLGFFEPGKAELNFEGAATYAAEMPAELFHPAASQGAVAMEILKSNQRAKSALAKINDDDTFAQITAERSFLAALKAGCQTPVGVNTALIGSTLAISVVVFDEDKPEAEPRTATVTLPVAEAARAGEIILKELR